MRKHSQFPSPIQEIALNLTFAVVRERRINRTHDEYMAIAARLPPLQSADIQNQPIPAAHEQVQRLQRGAAARIVSVQSWSSPDRLRIISEEDFVRDGSGCTGACGNATAKVAKELTHCASKLLLPLLR